MKLPLHILTIVLDGMPFLPMQLNCFNRLTCDWTWHCVEGPAANTNCTSWCQPQRPRFSQDGSHEFLQSLMNHPRCHVQGRNWWKGGKVEMCNAGIEHIAEPCILMQIDADELYEPWQIELLADRLSYSDFRSACVKMRYFLSPNIIAVGDNCYGNNLGEWRRIWKFTPGQKFQKHEPPVLPGSDSATMSRDRTAAYNIIPDHWAYYFESQVAYKEKFYGYTGAVEQWKRLQANTVWPVKRLKDWLPWVDERAGADLLHKPTHNWKRNPGDGQ